MARGIVCVGVPANIEVNDFKRKDGSEGQTLRFTLAHPATAMSGAVQCECRDESYFERIRQMSGDGEHGEFACTPDVVNFKNKKTGEDDHFFKLIVRGVISPAVC